MTDPLSPGSKRTGGTVRFHLQDATDLQLTEIKSDNPGSSGSATSQNSSSSSSSTAADGQLRIEVDSSALQRSNGAGNGVLSDDIEDIARINAQSEEKKIISPKGGYLIPAALNANITEESEFDSSSSPIPESSELSSSNNIDNNNGTPLPSIGGPTFALKYLSFTAPDVDYTAIESLPSKYKQFALVRSAEELKTARENIKNMTLEEKKEFVDHVSLEALPVLLKLGDYHGYNERNATIAWRNLYYAKDGVMRLQGVSGFLRPGMLLCVLGSNDSGVTTFFEVINGRRKGGKFSGELLINGKPPDESWQRIVGYVSKEDVHLPTLTVHETLFFSARLRTPGNVLDAQINAKIGVVLKMMGLSHVANNIVGDGLIRGISGGERRRLSYACELVAGHSVIIADLPTNGLDSASAYSLIQHAKYVAKAGRSLMCSLVQPAPELLDLFDFIQLMAKGSCVYFGPPAYVQSYLESIGFQRPLGKSLPDFLEEISAHPEKFFSLKEVPHTSLRFVTYDAHALAKRHHRHHSHAATKRKSQVAHHKDNQHEEKHKAERFQVGAVTGQWSDESDKKHPAALRLTHEGEAEEILKAQEERIAQIPQRAKVWLHLRNSYKSSVFYNELGLVHWNLLEPQPEFVNKPQEEERTFRTSLEMFLAMLIPYFSVFRNYNSSFFLQLKLTFIRQYYMTVRDKTLMGMTVGKNVIIGLVIGTLFYNLALDQAEVRTRFGLFFFCLTFTATGQIAFVPTVMRYRTLYYVQAQANYFHGSTYYLAFAVLGIPIAALESFIFTLVVYGMCGLQDNVFSNRYGYFFLAIWLINLVARSWIFLLCNISPNQTIATTLTPVTMLMFSIFAGYLNPKNTIPNGWIWMYYLSLYTYGIRGLSINEMFDLTYYCNEGELLPPPQNRTLTNGVTTCRITTGREALAIYDMDPGAGNGDSEKWTMVRNLAFFYIGFNFAAMMALLYVDWAAMDQSPPPQWQDHIKKPVRQRSFEERAEALAKSKKELKTAPAYLEWKQLKYSVELPDKSTRMLLKEVFGYSEPGKMTALMGASGAGKSTLLDVLSGMKTGGVIEGDILVNGQPKEKKTWSSIAGYVEQFDSHHPSSTVREAILFSSRLRLAKELSENEKQRRVDAIIEVLELEPFENQLIGSPETGGISPDIRKKVTIAVEMVMQPSILFLDEPTTGLEASGAVSVMTSVKKLCEDLGMSVLCTIHQPSAEIFSIFDSLLLLKAGGEVAYFGPLSQVSSYCKYIGYTECPPDKNIADHVMDIIKKATARQQEDKDALSLPKAYLEHPLGKTAISRLKDTVAPSAVRGVDNAHLIFDRVGFIGQFWELFWRNFNTHLRGAASLKVRIMMPIITGLLFGTLFYQLGSGQTDASNRISLIFMSVVIPVFSAASVFPDIFSARPVYFRERQANMYSPAAYFWARTLADVPLQWVESFIYCVVVYWMAGLTSEDNGTHFALFFLCYWFTRLAGLGLGYLVGTITPASEQANGMMQSMAVIMMLFSGFLISKGNIPDPWIWMYYLSIFHYSMGFLIPNELNDLTFTCSDSNYVYLRKFPSQNPNVTLTLADCQNEPVSNTTCYYSTCPITSGAQIMQQFSIDASQKNEDLGIVVAFVGFFFIFALIGLIRVNFIKR